MKRRHSTSTHTLDQALRLVQVPSLTSIPEVKGRHVVEAGEWEAVEFGGRGVVRVRGVSQACLLSTHVSAQKLKHWVKQYFPSSVLHLKEL